MSKPKNKGTKPKGGDKPKSGKAGRKDRAALRGMVLGMIIIAALAGFFMVPVAGKTTFTHLIHALGLQGGDDAPKGKGAEKKPSSARMGTPAAPRHAAEATIRPAPIRTAAVSTPAAAAARPKGVRVAENLHRRAPLEKASAADDAALDQLVRKHARD
jgi:hypothetical protein